jgi:hypothetical protein
MTLLYFCITLYVGGIKSDSTWGELLVGQIEGDFSR